MGFGDLIVIWTLENKHTVIEDVLCNQYASRREGRVISSAVKRRENVLGN